MVDISSTVWAAEGARAYWDWYAEAAAWFVAAAVVVEEFAEFDWAKRLVGVTWAKRASRFGWIALVLSLMAEVWYGSNVREQTDKIESALRQALSDTIAANADLGRKIEKEKTDIAAVKADTDQQKNDLKTARTDIGTLGGKEIRLNSALNSDRTRVAADEKRLDSQETNLSDSESKQAKNEKRLSELESETREYETENIDRGLAQNDARAVTTLKQFADIPIFLSYHDDPETRQFSNRVINLIWLGTGNKPKIIRDSPNNFPGVRVIFLQPFKSGSTDAEFVAMAHRTDHQRAAAMAICRELQVSNVDSVTAEVEPVDLSKPPSPINWDRALPEAAVLIRIGPAVRPLLYRKHMEMNGLEWMLKLEQETDKADAELGKALGRKGPCEPETF